ncbi:DUF4097 family beta strand repeat-containing protein [Sanguibacter sp. 25GB23B1]|uniref:DUF4097 family beta strand repeat-containing protein n=1 Tax=unclassified Sanguibacter TaxID=2645534 RepID=UPI0032AF93DD
MSAPVVDAQPTPPAGPDVPGDPRDPRSRPTPHDPRGPGARVLLWVGLTLGVLAIAQVGYQAIDWMSSGTRVTTQVYTAAAVVELTTDGDVTVMVGDPGSVTVEARTRTGFQRASHDAVESADRLAVEHDCPQWWNNGVCRIDLTVRVPRDTDVVVRSSSGAVRAEGVDGHLDLRTSDGDVRVLRAGGSVDAESSSGRVQVDDAGGHVVAVSGDGDVTVRNVGGHVTATSSSGRVVVAGADGDVSAVSGDGDVETRRIGGSAVVTTSSGEIEVGGVMGDVEAMSGDGDVVVRGTGSPVALKISTGDGRSTVEAPTDPTSSQTVSIRSSSGDVSYLDAS